MSVLSMAFSRADERTPVTSSSDRVADAAWHGLNHTLWTEKWQQLLLFSGLLHSKQRSAKDASCAILPRDYKEQCKNHAPNFPNPPARFLATSFFIFFSAGKSNAVTRIAHSSKRFVLCWTELVHTTGAIQCSVYRHLCSSAFYIVLRVNVLK